ncbi:MAG: UDP-N-acetylglucosamine 2-epimerase [Alphaproteobacteria bacterium]|jgi:UDP-N-acetylglucosamine 2-epimerase (non-hydrolysing)/GDP/UDP-N,N'-diacetylbacillosamine 2-epimerase (hydrolysing)|nr:UDP-N-acetylglucosamine 2-epimerase [Alphaproteobacteria bacterium]
MAQRTIAAVTGSRADYGLLYWVLREIEAAPELALRLVATGTHLATRFGETRRVILDDGFEIAAEVPFDLDEDTAAAVTRGMGEAAIGFATAFERLDPDIVLLLGDRYEIMAAAQAAMIAGLPIAHLLGGDVTVGAFDDSIRHCITKMAHLHFASNAESGRRLHQLGEDPESIWVTGNPGLDHIRRTALLDRAEFEAAIGFRLRRRNLLVTYHPETRARPSAGADFEALLSALDGLGDDVGMIFTAPNADPGNRAIAAALDAFAARDNAVVRDSLGQRLYLSAMAHADAMVGNSSSGLMEMPSFAKPTVNVGGRQDGRPRATSVIDVAADTGAIAAAIDEALVRDCRDVVNPYGTGDAAARIVAVLRRTVEPAALLRKEFHDLGVLAA